MKLPKIAFLIMIALLAPSRYTNVALADPPKACVQAVFINAYNIASPGLTLNVATGKYTVSEHTAVFPIDQPSPDGNHVVYWKQAGDHDAELYLAPITRSSTTRLFTANQDELLLDTSDFGPPLMGWSPDSRFFAFIRAEGDHFSINIVTADGRHVETQVVAPTAGKRYRERRLSFYGWSADGLFLVVGTVYDPFHTEVPDTEITVWRSQPLSSVAVFASWIGYNNSPYGLVAWSPNGHKLAMSLDNEDRSSDRLGKIAVWSPENGIEAETITPFNNDYYNLYWSPNGKLLWLHESWGHGEGKSRIYAVSNKIISGDEPESTRIFVGWSDNDSAIVVDSNKTDDDHTQTLKRLTPGTGRVQTLDSGIVGNQYMLSPDEKWIAYITKQGSTYEAKVIDVHGNNKNVFFTDTLTFGAPQDDSLGYTNLLSWSADSQFVSLRWTSEILQNYEHQETTIISDVHGTIMRQVDTGGVEGVVDSWFVYVKAKGYDDGILEAMNAQTGQTLELATFHDPIWREGGLAWPVLVSPDGKSIVGTVGGSVLGIASIANGKSGQILRDGFDISVEPWHKAEWKPYILAWSPDSSMLAYIDNAKSTTTLMVVDRMAQVVGKVELTAALNIEPILGGIVTWVPCT